MVHVVDMGGCVDAAFTVDKRWMGRVRMQIMGFFFVTIIFLMCAIFYGDLVKPGANIRWFQVRPPVPPPLPLWATRCPVANSSSYVEMGEGRYFPVGSVCSIGLAVFHPVVATL